MRRKLKRWFAFLVLMTGLSIVGLYLARDPLRNALARFVSSQASGFLHGTLHIGALRGTLLTSLILRDVVLQDAREEVLRIEEIRLTYTPFSLLRGTLTVTADLWRPQVTVRQAPDGSLNVSQLFPPSKPAPSSSAPLTPDLGLPFAVTLQHLRLHDGQVTLSLPSITGVQRLEHLEIAVQGQVDRQGLHVSLQQLTARALPADVALQALEGAFYWSLHGMELRDVRLQTAQTLVTVHGPLPGSTQAANAVLALQPVDLPEIGRLLGNPRLQGVIQANLQIQGTPEALQLQGEVRTPSGILTLQGEADTRAQPLRYQASVSLHHLDLAAMLAQEPLRSDLNLHAQIMGSGMRPAEMRGEVHLDIPASHLGRITIQPSRIHLTLQPQQVRIEALQLDTSVAQMSATGILDLTGNSSLTYHLHAQLAELQELLALPDLQGEVRLQGQMEGTLAEVDTRGSLQVARLRYQENQLHTLQLMYEGTPFGTRPRFTGRLQVQQVLAGSVPIEQITAEATYDGTARQLLIEMLHVRLAHHDWKTPEPCEVAFTDHGVQLKHIQLVHANEAIKISGALEGQHLQDVRLELQQIDLTFLQKWLGLPDPVHGQVSAQVALTGTLTDPRLQAGFAWQPAARPQKPFDILDFTLAYAEKQLHSTVRVQQQNRDIVTGELQLPVDATLTALPLAERLLEAPMILRTALKRPDLAVLRYLHPAIPPLRGTMEGTLTLQGPYSALTLETEGRLQQMTLPGMLEQVSAPLRLRAEIITAASVEELRQALKHGNAGLQIRNLALRVSSLQGSLLAPDTPPRRVNLHDIVLDAAAQIRQGNVQATIARFDAQLAGDGIPSTSLQMAAQLTPKQLDLTRLDVRLARSEFHGKGQLTLPGQEVQLRLEFPRVRLDDVASSWPATLPADLQGTLDIRGRVTAPTMDMRLQYAGARVHLAGTAHIPEQRYRMTLQWADLDVARFMPAEQGRVQGVLEVQGNGFAGAARQGNVELRLTAPALTLAPKLEMRFQARMTGDTISLDTIRLQSEPLTFTAGGTLSLTEQVNVHYRAVLGDLTALQRRLRVPLQGKGTLQGTLQGRLQEPRTQGKLSIEQWRYADWQGERIQADWQGSRLFVAPEAAFNAQIKDVKGPSLSSSDIRLNGQYKGQEGSLKVAVLDGPFRNTALEGRVTMAATTQVTLSRLRLQRQNLAWENAGAIEAARFPDGTLELGRFLLRSGKQEIRLQGKMHPQGLLQGELALQRIQLAATLQAFSPQTKGPDGQLELAVTFAGTVQQPRLSGTLHLQAVEWQKQSLGNLQGRFSTADQSAQLALRWHDKQQDLLGIDGTVGFASPQPLALHVQAADFDLRRLKAFSTEVIDSAGTLRLDLRIQGTPQQPQLYGGITVQDGLMHLKATGERYKDIQARLTLAGERLAIEQLQVHSRTGPLSVTGWAETADAALKRLALNIKSQEFTVMHTEDMEAIVSTAIQIEGSLQAMEATGTVKIPRARIRLSGALAGEPETIQPWQLTVNGVYGSGPPGSKPGTASDVLRPANPLPFLQANLRVDMPRNVWIQGPGTAVELSGDLRVQKARQEPFIVSGAVQTIRGFAKFYGKKFTVQNGTVTFTGSPEINPLLDVTATHQVSEYLIAIHATGKARQPKIDLSSTPEVSQGDILSLLVVGKTTDRLTSSEQSSVSDSFQRVLGNVAGGQLENLVGKELGLDTIEIEAGEKPGDARVSVGRYVTQDLFLSYEQQIGQKAGTSIGLEYSINRRLKLKGSGSNTGESALDVLWRIEY